MKYYIGVDLGGTNVRVAKVSETGEVVQVLKRPSQVEQGRDFVVDTIIDMIEHIDGYEEVQGIGLGVPGPVDTVNKVMKLATNLPGFEGFKAADKIQQHFNKPTYLDNDANVAGLAEALVGAGKGLPISYYVTISTGIGGALVVNGKLISGANGYAGEVANIIIDRKREKINFLNVGAVENEASGTAITRKGRQLFGDEIRHAGDVFDLARAGDAKALALVDEAAYDLAQMFSIIAHIVDPNCFVLGGGVMAGKDVFFDKMVAYFKEMVHVQMRDVAFVEAALEDPGIVGAAMLPASHE
ncbi:MAG: ROK family protein [Erysipelotrichaceae bacterium]